MVWLMRNLLCFPVFPWSAFTREYYCLLQIEGYTRYMLMNSHLGNMCVNFVPRSLFWLSSSLASLINVVILVKLFEIAVLSPVQQYYYKDYFVSTNSIRVPASVLLYQLLHWTIVVVRGHAMMQKRFCDIDSLFTSDLCYILVVRIKS